MGGLARRATLIQKVRNENAGAVLVVDAGNTLLGDVLALKSEGRVIIDAMNLMGYDALGVGTGELMKGPDVLRDRVAEAQFPVLSSNLIDSATGEPVLEPYVIIVRGGVRFGVIGITSANALEGLESLWPGVSVLPPAETLSGYMDELRAQSDLIVVLSQLGLDADRVLVTSVEGIDVLVGGNTRWLLTEAETLGSTTIIQAGYDGEWLGRLDLQGLPAELSVTQYQILYMRPDVANDPAMAELVQRYYAEYPSGE
ncbi:MAG: bifunctional metallophosphatase/5'-nucleotidase [Anaerolineae bacterium]